MSYKLHALFLFVFFSSEIQIASAEMGPLPVNNPSVGLPGGATMHGDGDTASSDATPLPGPGDGAVRSRFTLMLGACSTVLIRNDGRPMVLCTSWFGRAPVVRLLNRSATKQLARIRLPEGSLLGGVYAYLDLHSGPLSIV